MPPSLQVRSEPHPDMSAQQAGGPYYDPKATPAAPRCVRLLCICIALCPVANRRPERLHRAGRARLTGRWTAVPCPRTSSPSCSLWHRSHAVPLPSSCMVMRRCASASSLASPASSLSTSSASTARPANRLHPWSSCAAAASPCSVSRRPSMATSPPSFNRRRACLRGWGQGRGRGRRQGKGIGRAWVS